MNDILKPRCVNCINIRKNKEQLPCRQCYEYDKWERLYTRAEIQKILYQALEEDCPNAINTAYTKAFINSVLLCLEEEKL